MLGWGALRRPGLRHDGPWLAVMGASFAYPVLGVAIGLFEPRAEAMQVVFYKIKKQNSIFSYFDIISLLD